MTLPADWQAPLDPAEERPAVTLAHQIAEVRRELALRKSAYPRFIAKGTLRQGEADECMRRLQGVHDHLMWVERNEAAIRAAAKREGWR